MESKALILFGSDDKGIERLILIPHISVGAVLVLCLIIRQKFKKSKYSND